MGDERSSMMVTYLLQFVCDHGERSKDAVCGACDSDDPLRTGALRDVDPRATLWGERLLGLLVVNLRGWIHYLGIYDHTSSKEKG